MGVVSRHDRPHVVQVTCHDLGRHLGCYGAATVRTPNLDGLAAAGVRFEQVFCTAPQCSPSRSSLATGRYPHANGVMGLAHDGFGWDLNPGERHIAALLAEYGYQTHLFGLQHVTMEIDRLGFAHVHRRGLGPDVATDVEAMLGAAPSDTPLYLEINLEEPHRPYDQGGVNPDTSAGVQVPPWLPDTEAAREEFAAFQGAVHAADTAIGRILAAIDAAGLTETTLFIFTDDHGVAMPRAKCTLYDPGIGVALIVRWPAGGLRAGSSVSSLISNVDVVPTLLEATGTAAPGNFHGRSFLPLLRGDSSTPRDAIYAEKTHHSYYDPMRAIRTERYKFIRNFETSFQVEVPGDVQPGAIYRTELQRYISATHPDVEIYDLAADPWEQRNLAGQPEVAEAERELDARLWQWMQETGDPLLVGPVPSPAYRRSMLARPQRGV
ncbi:MAG: N-sulfoglucosamine sulfohydrolase [Thermomicrobiales bacterium]|nr:N-sulfoglucosamine sulfohydrolase [Thermomicrobiales bacterium]